MNSLSGPLFRGAVALVAVSLLSLASATGAGAYVGDVDLPQVATNPTNGDVSFVWKQRDATEGGNGCCDIITGRKRLANGTLGSPFPLSAGGQHADSPQVAVAPDGKATFVWIRFDGSHPTDPRCCTIVQARARTGDGALGSPFNVSGDGVNATNPQVAVAADGKVTFVWQHGNVIKGRQRSAGGTLGSTFNLSTTGPDANNFAPALAVAPDGVVTFMWGSAASSGPPTTFMARRRLANGTMGSAFPVSEPAQYTGLPQVVVDSNGKATFSWQQFNGANQLILGRARSADGALSPIFPVSSTGQNAYDQQMAVAPDGKVTFVWNNSSIGTVEGRARTGGGTMGTIFPVSVTGVTGDNVDKPQVAVAPNDGRVLFAWVRNDGSGSGNVPVQGRARNGSQMSGIFDVSPSTGFHEGVQLATAPDGKTTYIWRRTVPGGNGTYAQGRARLSNGTLGGVFDLSDHPNNTG